MSDNYLNTSALDYLCRSLNVIFAKESTQLPTIAGRSINEETGSVDLYNVNLNTVLTSGFYNAMLCSNAKYEYSALLVIGYYLTGYCFQLQADITSNKLAVRTQINGTWSSWVEIDTSAYYTKTETDAAIAAMAVTASHDGNGTVTISGISSLNDAATESY